MSSISTCPSPERLRHLLLGQISDEAAGELERHVEACPACSRLLPSLETEDALTADMRAQRTVSLDAEELATIQILLPQLHALGTSVEPAKTDLRSAGQKLSGEFVAEANAIVEFAAMLNSSESGELPQLGPYRLLELLGEGGMGMVFRAEDVQLKRTVALKVMRPELARQAAARDRFLREGQATAKIEHEHIVTVFQVGEERSIPYLAMQLLKGMSLQDLLASSGAGVGLPLNLGRILRIGRETAAALTLAHGHGLIHRDIKPSNIWLDAAADGRVKILDFGLARALDDEAHLTHFGTIIGSPSFMAPEQARHGVVDCRTDLFSLGCVLYRLIAGRLPWTGKDAVGTLVAIATEEPIPLESANPQVPPAVARLVAQLLAKAPHDRPASATDVVVAIETIERELPAEVLAWEMPAVGSEQKSTHTPSAVVPSRRSLQPPRKRRGWGLLAACGGLPLAVLAAAIYIHTDSGVLEIDTGGDEVRLVVEQNGKQVQAIDAKGDTHLTLPAGDYKLRLEPVRPDVKLSSDQVKIKRGSQALVRVDTEHDRQIVDTPKLPSEYRNSIGMRLMLIPAGEFVMGSPLTEVGRQADEQPHRVVISRPYYMGACMVSIGEFRQFVEVTSYVADGGSDWKSAPSALSDDFPVGNVSWNDAVAFCDWLSKKESSRYRLPTEAEWEYACRAGTKTTRFCGDDLRVLPQYAWCHENSGNVLHPGGRLKPNPWGLYDMLGNVWQWTNDWYAADYYPASPIDDPPGPSAGTNRVMRGGTFAISVKELRSAWRHGYHDPSWRRRHVGFRVVQADLLKKESADSIPAGAR